MDRQRIPYEVKEWIGQLGGEPGDRYRMEVRLIDWNNRGQKYDIREWEQRKDGTEKPLKGVTLTAAQYEALKKLLNESGSNETPGQLSLFGEGVQL